jgi:hypothetical protein
MKKTIILLAITIALLTSANSQISVSIPVGISTLGAPTAGVNVQAAIKSLRVAAGFDNHFSKDLMKGNLVWARMGAGFRISDLNSMEITAGAGQFRRSTDQKNLNQRLAVVNAQYVHTMKNHPEASAFASITGTQKFVMFTGGLRLTFLKRSSGCPSSRFR